jgi:hypothetical protein
MEKSGRFTFFFDTNGESTDLHVTHQRRFRLSPCSCCSSFFNPHRLVTPISCLSPSLSPTGDAVLPRDGHLPSVHEALPVIRRCWLLHRRLSTSRSRRIAATVSLACVLFPVTVAQRERKVRRSRHVSQAASTWLNLRLAFRRSSAACSAQTKASPSPSPPRRCCPPRPPPNSPPDQLASRRRRSPASLRRRLSPNPPSSYSGARWCVRACCFPRTDRGRGEAGEQCCEMRW